MLNTPVLPRTEDPVILSDQLNFLRWTINSSLEVNAINFRLHYNSFHFLREQLALAYKPNTSFYPHNQFD